MSYSMPGMQTLPSGQNPRIREKMCHGVQQMRNAPRINVIVLSALRARFSLLLFCFSAVVFSRLLRTRLLRRWLTDFTIPLKGLSPKPLCLTLRPLKDPERNSRLLSSRASGWMSSAEASLVTVVPLPSAPCTTWTLAIPPASLPLSCVIPDVEAPAWTITRGRCR